MKLYIAGFLYMLNLLLVLVLAICYFREIRGIWPPSSRRMFVFGWAWYVLIYVLAVWVYLLELRSWMFIWNAWNVLLLVIDLFMVLVGGCS